MPGRSGVQQLMHLVGGQVLAVKSVCCVWPAANSRVHGSSDTGAICAFSGGATTLDGNPAISTVTQADCAPHPATHHAQVAPDELIRAGCIAGYPHALVMHGQGVGRHGLQGKGSEWHA